MGQHNVKTWVLGLVSCVLFTSHVAAQVPREVKQMLRLGNYAQAGIELRQGSTNDPEQAFTLARLYRQNLIKPPQINSTQELFTQAADAGHVGAMYQLGRLYQTGDGLPRDISHAKIWFTRAAAQGHSPARRQLNQIAKITHERTEDLSGALASCKESKILEQLKLVKTFEQNLMYQAIACDGSAALYKAMIGAGANPAFTDQEKNTFLHKAVASDAVTAARTLISAGASRTAKNSAGWSPTMLAERSENGDIHSLFNHNPTANELNIDIAEAVQQSRFKDWPPLNIAAWLGDDDLVKQLLKSNAANLTDKNGHSALHRAIERKHRSIALLLLQQGALPSLDDFELLGDLRDKIFLEPYAKATGVAQLADEFYCYGLKTGNVMVLESHVATGSQPPTHCNETPILVYVAKLFADQQNSSDVIEMLLDIGVEINALDTLGCSALCWALRGDQREFSSTLILHGASNQADNRGITPLMLAAQNGDLQSLLLLINRAANINQQSLSGSHALLLAGAAGHAEIVESLLAHDADIDLKNSIGDTALIEAIRQDQYEVSRILVIGGASTRTRNEKFENARDLIKNKNSKWQDIVASRNSLWTFVN